MSTIEAAAAALRSGEPVILPTDTVYGVAVLAWQPGATAALFDLKARPPDAPLPVLVADRDHALELAAAIPPEAERLVARWWPGPLTVVLARREGPARAIELGGDPSTIGLRCPAHEIPRRLAALVGPLVTTSANRHGEPAPATAQEAAAALPTVRIVLDGGPSAGTASTVVDCTDPGGAGVRILRVGPLAEADVLATARAVDSPHAVPEEGRQRS